MHLIEFVNPMDEAEEHWVVAETIQCFELSHDRIQSHYCLRIMTHSAAIAVRGTKGKLMKIVRKLKKAIAEVRTLQELTA
jgi:hypothetical protein